MTAVLSLTVLMFLGCGDPPADPVETTSENSTAATDDHGHDHGDGGHDDHGDDHHAGGPHGGIIIDLAGGDYHAELIHDSKTLTATIYILDSSAKKAAAIDSEFIRMNLKHHDGNEQHELKPTPEESDPEGKSSKFALTNKAMSAELDHGDAEVRLVLKIGDKSYSGKINLLDHSDHGHGHDKDHHHGKDGDKDKDAEKKE